MQATQEALPKKYLNPQQAAEYLGVQPRTLEAWRHRGGGPRYALISNRLCRYSVADLDDFMHSRIRTSTGDTGAER